MQLSMIALREAHITLPFLWGEKRRVARNPLFWQGQAQQAVECTLYECDEKTLCARTSMKRPFHELFIRLPRCKTKLPRVVVQRVTAG